MKFIRKIGDGDVTVNENKVTELNPSERADVWAQQFSSQSKQVYHTTHDKFARTILQKFTRLISEGCY